MVLIKVFNEVISTQEYMSYLLFSPPGFLTDVYKAYLLFSKLIYEIFPSLRSSSYEFSWRQHSLYVVSFSPYFSHWVLKEFSQHIKYYSPHIFSTGFLEELFNIIYACDQRQIIHKIIQGVQPTREAALYKGEC